MNRKEFRVTINKFALSKRQLSILLNHESSYLATLVSRDEEKTEIPTHLETIVNLLFSLKIKNIDYTSILEEIHLGSSITRSKLKENTL